MSCEHGQLDAAHPATILALEPQQRQVAGDARCPQPARYDLLAARPGPDDAPRFILESRRCRVHTTVLQRTQWNDHCCPRSPTRRGKCSSGFGETAEGSTSRTLRCELSPRRHSPAASRCAPDRWKTPARHHRSRRARHFSNDPLIKIQQNLVLVFLNRPHYEIPSCSTDADSTRITQPSPAARLTYVSTTATMPSG